MSNRGWSSPRAATHGKTLMPPARLRVVPKTPRPLDDSEEDWESLVSGAKAGSASDERRVVARVAPLIERIIATQFDGKGGSAALYTGMAGMSASFAFVDTQPVSLFGGAGYAGVWLRAVGHPETGFVGRTADAFTSAGFVHVMARIHLSPTLSLAPEARLGVSVPPAAIQFDRERAARWGLPWGALAISIEADVIH